MCKHLAMALLGLLAIAGAAMAVFIVFVERNKAAKRGDRYAVNQAAKDAASGFSGGVGLVLGGILLFMFWFALYNLAK